MWTWLMSYHVKTTLCHDIMTYDISWQPQSIVDNVSLKFTSDEAARQKVDILELLLHSQLLALPNLFIETSLPNQGQS